MSDLLNLRRDVDVSLGGAEYRCKPTIGKALEIEEKFGPIPVIIQRFGSGAAGVREVVEMMAIIVRGCKGAPDQQKIRQIVFAEGIIKHIPAVVTFLSNAIRTDEPAEESFVKEGGESGKE